MHSGVSEHLARKAVTSTTTVVSASEWTIGGTMSQSELEDLIRSASQYNARVSLESGALKIRLGR